jgi:hypothetical protein
MKPADRALEGKDMGERGIRRSMRKQSMRGGHSRGQSAPNRKRDFSQAAKLG